MSKNSLFTPKDRKLSEILVSIIYTNPFRTERAELNNQFFKLSEKRLQQMSFNPVKDLLSENENIQSYTKIAYEILETARQTILTSPTTIPLDDYQIYEHLSYFYLFHQNLPSIDDYIRLCLENPQANPRWNSFHQLKKEYHHYLKIRPETTPVPSYSLEELASFCFQIRRAFYHTYHTVKGSSKAIHILRAQVWDSIFTHNMRRYLRSLYQRMSDIYTLITGPSGSGKEIVASCIGLSRFIPFNSDTQKFERNFTDSFHGINLSALSSTLMESELFGHKKGAFTGALQDKAGYFESCGKYGTVFLDEIGDTNTEIQIKLLRVLQTRQFQRLGDTQTQNFKGKVMAATNVDLVKAIEQGRFREDFYYRLCADQIQTPALEGILNENKDELENLLDYICKQFVGDDECDELRQECINWISRKIPQNYTWPGNFRELEQCVKNIIVRGSYHPHSITINSKSPYDNIRNGSMDLDSLLSFYINQEYARTPSFAEVAHRLKIDPRTVKKHL